MRRLTTTILIALALVGCGSIPKPPQCDESNKRPLNQARAPQAVERGGAQ